MGTYFLDTSALVKNYVTEIGSPWIIEHCQPDSGHTIIISQATLVEAVAALCRKARATDFRQRISEADRDHNISLFRQDVQRRYNLVQVAPAIYTYAGDLCRMHRLRAYDAVQLACALGVRNDSILNQAPEPIFVSADTGLLEIAITEGFSVEDPNSYP